MKKIILLLCILSLSACSKVVHFSNATLSTKDINVSHVNLEKMPQAKNVKGESAACYDILSIIPLCGSLNTMGRGIDEAVDDALAKGQGDLMINAQIKVEENNYFLWKKSKAVVRGTVINLQGGR